MKSFAEQIAALSEAGYRIAEAQSKATVTPDNTPRTTYYNNWTFDGVAGGSICYPMQNPLLSRARP